jgi:hypothetical protein
MNKERRKALAEIQADVAKAKSDLESASAALGELKGEEEEYLENMPDSFKDGDKGSAAQEAIDAMDEAINSIDEATNGLDDIDSQLDTAQQ